MINVSDVRAELRPATVTVVDEDATARPNWSVTSALIVTEPPVVPRTLLGVGVMVVPTEVPPETCQVVVASSIV